MLGHVNNAKYISYIEQARIEFFNFHVPDFDWTNAGIILARTEIDYLLPLHLKDQLEVSVHCSRTGSKSFDLTYSLNNTCNNTHVACAKTIMVCYDYITKKSMPIPEKWKGFLQTI